MNSLRPHEHTPQQNPEIERKFLVEKGFEIELFSQDALRIRQGYLEVCEDGSEDRVREVTDSLGNVSYTRTQKVGTGLVRGEIEEEISPEEFADLWGSTEGARVFKIRYQIPDGDVTIEYDVYQEDLAGLKVAEVEFPDEPTAKAYQKPKWFGDEVTDDYAYKNQQLAGKTFIKIPGMVGAPVLPG